MAITKDKKKEIVAKISDIVKDSKSLVFFNFHGLKVADATPIRRKLRSAGVGYLVAKKSLTKRALDEAKIEGAQPELAGEVGFAYSKDLIAPAREIFEFQKKHKENLTILGGVFDGKYMSKEEMTTIALIPPLHALYAQFVNVINSPIQGLVMALDAISRQKA